MRHDLLHEIMEDRERVVGDIAFWLDEHLAGRAPKLDQLPSHAATTAAGTGAGAAAGTDAAGAGASAGVAGASAGVGGAVAGDSGAGAVASTNATGGSPTKHVPEPGSVEV